MQQCAILVLLQCFMLQRSAGNDSTASMRLLVESQALHAAATHQSTSTSVRVMGTGRRVSWRVSKRHAVMLTSCTCHCRKMLLTGTPATVLASHWQEYKKRPLPTVVTWSTAAARWVRCWQAIENTYDYIYTCIYACMMLMPSKLIILVYMYIANCKVAFWWYWRTCLPQVASTALPTYYIMNIRGSFIMSCDSHTRTLWILIFSSLVWLAASQKHMKLIFKRIFATTLKKNCGCGYGGSASNIFKKFCPQKNHYCYDFKYFFL